jgi:Transposase DDE domain
MTPPPDRHHRTRRRPRRWRTGYAPPSDMPFTPQRSHIAETPFGHAKHNMGFRRLTSCGIARATAEFSFHALVHNLLKAIGTGHLAPAAC